MEKVNLVEEIISTSDETPSPAPARKAITPAMAEKWGVAWSLVIGYAYVMSVLAEGLAWQGWLLAFAAMLCLGAALALREARPQRECWVWLACLWCCLLLGIFGKNRVWGEHVWLFIHLFGAYWLIARSGRLLGGGSSVYLPADLFYGLLVYPFKHFALRFRVLRASVAHGGKRRMRAGTILAASAAVAVALFLLALAALLLSDADPNFERLMDGIWRALDGIDPSCLFYLALSLPVGAYLYGMVFGAQRESAEAVAARRAAVDSTVRAIRRVPAAVWPLLLGLFAALYLVFFGVQGSYLFDGLRGLLPERFTAAQYARRGFFELCGVMAVNFALLGAAAISAEGGLRSRRSSLWMATVLLVESGLFAVTAASKLWLYIRRFGFTPLRLQSCWMVAVLLAGCFAALRHLWTGKDATRAWLIFAGATLAALHAW